VREDEVRGLGAAMAGETGFVQHPTWFGRPAENGPWARRRTLAGGHWLAATAWTRLAARWIELVELAACARDGTVADALRFGAVPLSGRDAIAWCEMARGTLLHRVRLDGSGHVQDWLVLAPTEWNFQPDGMLAAWARQLAADDEPTASALAAAFDPCVPCAVGA
jgi:coenzyme F420-reducing hydrogenase alpha subunit